MLCLFLQYNRVTQFISIYIFFLKIYLFIYCFWLCWVFVVARRVSLVALSGGCSLGMVCRLLSAAVSLIVEHGLSGEWASAVVVPGSRAQTQQLWCVGLAAPWTAVSSRARDWTHFSCIDRVPSLDQEDPLEQNMATHSSVLAWRIPWTGKPGGLQTMGSQRIRHDWARKPDTVFVAADGIVSFF